MSQVIAERFEIQEIIGQGGMGTVYKGHDRQTGETVAIKTIKREVLLEDPELIERFEREGEALRQLNHPNIVKMIAAIHENGVNYLVLEYVDGGSLLDLLRETPQLPLEKILHIGLDLADALTRAHRLKIIHRDIKPANVLLGKDGTPRLTDFGVARISKNTTGTITKTGAVVGTFSYLSPEACEGKRIDARTDIWSFGVMLYEMLAGRRPYESDSQTAVLLDIMTKPVPDIFEFRSDTPPQFAMLLLKMLEKDKDNRISSVRLVGAELENMLENFDTAIRSRVATGEFSRFSAAPPTPSSSQPITWEGATITPSSTPSGVNPHATVAPTPTQPPPVIPPPAQSSRWGVMGGILALLAVMIGIGAFLVLGGGEDNSSEESSAPPAPTFTVTPSVLLVEPVAEDENLILVADLEQLGSETQDVKRFILEDLTNRLETGAPIAKIRIRSYAAVITSEAQAIEAAEANNAHLVVWGNYDEELITLNISAGVVETNVFNRTQIEKSIGVQYRLEDVRRESLALPVLGSLTLVHTFEDRTYDAAIMLIVMEPLSEQQVTPKLVSAGVSANLQRYYVDYYADSENSIEEMDQALTIEPSFALLYSQRGSLLQRIGKFEEAERDLNTALRLSNEQWSVPYIVLSNNESLQGDTEGAITYLDQALELNPNDWFSLSLRGGLYYLDKNYERAKEDYDSAIAIDPPSGLPYVFANILAIREGRLNDSIEMLNVVLTEFPDPTILSRLAGTLAGGEDNSNQYFSLTLSAFANMVLGQYEAAIVDAEEAIEIQGDLADLYLLKGVAYCSLEDFAAAEETYTQGIEIEPDFTILYLLRAEVRNKQANLAGALEDFSVAQESEIWPNVEAILGEEGADSLGCNTFFGG